MKYLLYILSIFCCANVYSQVFPVQVNTQLLPPYTPYLTDYTVPGAQKLMVQLRVNDPTLSDYTCKLRISIEGLGITIRTKPTFIPQPITLQGGGIPQIFYGEDLAEYFQSNNLDFAGISRREFEKGARLPEGVYRFSVEVLDYNRGTVVSNKGFSIAWIILNDPPLLNLPRRDSKVNILDPTNIVFNWTPRHKGSPNSAFTTEYIFRLVEIWPLNRNPYDAFLAQQPLYEVTTDLPQIVYGPAEPALIPGRKYAWQVQAIDNEGRDLFKNQGRSEVYVFQFGDEIGIPENLRKEGGNATTLSLRWEPSPKGEMPDQYRIRYKKINGNTWYENITDQRWSTLSQLQPATSYEIQIRAEKGNRYSEYSVVQKLNTAEKSDTPFTCGQPANISTPSNTNSLFALTPGDIFSSADFKVVVTEVNSAENGMFTGKGIMPVNLLNGASVEVTFSGNINNNYELTTGSVITVYQQGSAIAQVVDEMHRIGEKKPQQLKTDSLNTTPPVDYIYPGIIDSVFVNAQGEIIAIDEDGNETTYQPAKDKETGKIKETAIADSAGNTYTVSPDGKVTKTAGPASQSTANLKSLPITFKADTSQMFGFDKLFYDLHADNYEKANVNGVETLVSWKSVASGTTDKVIAWSDKKDLFDEVRYRSLTGKLPEQKNEHGVQLTITGTSHEEVSEIEAYLPDSTSKDKETIVGRLNVISYDAIVRNLVLIPVNGAPLPSIASLKDDLNKIFGPAIVAWNVRSEDNLEIDLGSDKKLDDGSSGILSNYTQEMREVIRVFKDRDDIENDTYYLFFVAQSESGNKDGYMPRKKQCGFIFTQNQREETLAKTIGHELAHGAFRLEHSFETYPSLSKGTTDNLMDYNTGTRLHKYQWDLVHNPVAVWGVFEGDEEGSYAWTLVDKKHTLLFNHIYDNHNIENLVYLKKFETATEETLNLDYKNDEENEWVNSWKIRVINLDSSFNDELASIIKTNKGEKIPQIALRPKHIYLGKYKHDGKEYPVAIYGNGKETVMKNAFTKVQVTEISELQKEENRKHIYVEETYTKYFIIAFYEQDVKEPSMIMQIEKFTFANSMEKWLEYLSILIKEKEVDKNCVSHFCCTKCGKDLTMTDDKFSSLFPKVHANKQEYIDAFNVTLQEDGFQYNTCERQAKIFAQIAVETNNLSATKEGAGRTWKLTGANQLLDYFKATAKAKVRWFNPEFWTTKLYKQFCQTAYYEKIEAGESILSSARYKPTDTTDCYGVYKNVIQSQYHVQIPILFVKDSLGEFKKYETPTLAEKEQIEKNIYNYAYGNSLGNGDYLTTNDGFDYRGKGAIQVTGKSSYVALNAKLKAFPYNVTEVDIVANPDAIADVPKLIVYSAFIHFKGQLKKDIKKLDELSIDKVSALVNTGNENGVANHADSRRNKYETFIKNEFKCEGNE